MFNGRVLAFLAAAVLALPAGTEPWDKPPERWDLADARLEFHFPREVEGHPAIDPQSEKIEFHCKDSVKTPRPGRQNALSSRTQFHPRLMRVNGVPDL